MRQPGSEKRFEGRDRATGPLVNNKKLPARTPGLKGPVWVLVFSAKANRYGFLIFFFQPVSGTSHPKPVSGSGTETFCDPATPSCFAPCIGGGNQTLATACKLLEQIEPYWPANCRTNYAATSCRGAMRIRQQAARRVA